MNKKIIAALLVGATILPALQGCFPLVAAGVATGVLATFDRRTLGAQTDDETIEWKASSRIGKEVGGHVSFASFNRKLLMTGEVPTAEAKAEAERIAASVTNVHSVYNELVVGPASSYTDRSNDLFITSKVKGRFVDNGKFNPVHVKVVSEAGAVYLLGMVTPGEADAAIAIARTTSGVKKVVNLLDIITPAEARELDVAQQNNAPKNTTAP